MCRSIKVLHNFEPPATPEEIRASALQFVRKISGTRKPSKANLAAFEQAVDAITETSTALLESLVATTPKKNREEEAAKARAKWKAREARS